MSGTSGSIRQAEELSTTTAPAAANLGASASSTVTSRSPNGSTVPAERAEEKKRTEATGNPRSSRICRIAAPTCPVAPTTPTSRSLMSHRLSGSPRRCSRRSGAGERRTPGGGSSSGSAVDDGLHLGAVEVEGRVGGLHRRRHVGLVYDHRDPDLGGRDHLDVDSGVGEGSEELRGDARVGAHP